MPVSVRRLTRKLLQAALVVLALCYPRPAAGQTEYSLIELNGFTPAYAVNDSGTVVGFWNGPNGSRGYRWTQADGTQPIITDPATINQFPIYDFFPRRLAINVNGVIAGQATVTQDGRTLSRGGHLRRNVAGDRLPCRNRRQRPGGTRNQQLWNGRGQVYVECSDGIRVDERVRIPTGAR